MDQLCLIQPNNKHENALIAKKFRNRSRKRRFRTHQRSRRVSYNSNRWKMHAIKQAHEIIDDTCSNAKYNITIGANGGCPCLSYCKIRHCKSNNKYNESKHQKLKKFLSVEPFVKNSYLNSLKNIMNHFPGKRAKKRVLKKIIETYPNKPPGMMQQIFRACSVEKYITNQNIVKYSIKRAKNNVNYDKCVIDMNDDYFYYKYLLPKKESSFDDTDRYWQPYWQRRKRKRGWYHFGFNRFVYDTTPEPHPLTHVTFDKQTDSRYDIKAQFSICITNNTDCQGALMIHSISLKIFETKSKVVVKELDELDELDDDYTQDQVQDKDKVNDNCHDNVDDGIPLEQMQHESEINDDDDDFGDECEPFYRKNVVKHKIVIKNKTNKVVDVRLMTYNEHYQNLPFITGFKCGRNVNNSYICNLKKTSHMHNYDGSIGIGSALAVDGVYPNQHFQANPYLAYFKSKQCKPYLYTLCQMLWNYTFYKNSMTWFNDYLDYKSLKFKYNNVNQNSTNASGQSIDQALRDIAIYDKIRNIIDFIPIDIISTIKLFVGKYLINFDKFEMINIEGNVMNPNNQNHWSLKQFMSQKKEKRNSSSVIFNQCFEDVIDKAFVSDVNVSMAKHQFKTMSQQAVCCWDPAVGECQRIDKSTERKADLRVPYGIRIRTTSWQTQFAVVSIGQTDRSKARTENEYEYGYDYESSSSVPQCSNCGLALGLFGCDCEESSSD